MKNLSSFAICVDFFTQICSTVLLRALHFLFPPEGRGELMVGWWKSIFQFHWLFAVAVMCHLLGRWCFSVCSECSLCWTMQKTLLVLTYRALKCSSGAFRTLNNNAAVKERMTVRQDVCKIRRSSSFRLTERQTGGHTLSSKCEVCQECVRGRERKANKVRRMKIEIFHSQSNHF